MYLKRYAYDMMAPSAQTYKPETIITDFETFSYMPSTVAKFVREKWNGCGLI